MLSLILALWFIQALDIVSGILFKTPVLKPGQHPLPGSLPKISIIVAARNEAPHVREALSTMLAQDYPDYEVIAINDRSEDETGTILKSFNDPKLKTLDIRNLPDGWLGKNHALHQGYLASSGSWLLFTDADVHFHPNTLKASVSAIVQANADHLVVFPKMICNHWTESVFTGAFIMAFFRRFRPWAAQNPKSSSFVGVGAFNMVRRETYQSAGTHERIALDVLDDLHLGKLIKINGGKQLAVSGPDLVSVQWVKDWSGVLLSLEKNAFAGFDYKVWLMVAATFAGLLVDIFPYLGIFFAPTAPLCRMILLCVAACYLAAQKINRWSFFAFFTHGFGVGLILVLVWRSALKILKEGGVTWRGTFYSLAQLRAYSKI